MKSNIYINIQTNEKGNEKRYATETAPYYIYSYSNPADIPTTGKEKAMKTDAVDSEKIAWSLIEKRQNGAGLRTSP